jgi:ABC-type nickel/cobalt efflux system permease component RcnA
LVWPAKGIIVAALSFIWMLLSVGISAAHPLGNFSVNQYSGIQIDRDAVEVRYIVDMAEIPTFQEIQETGFTTNATDASARAYLSRKIEALRDGLELQVNGRSLPLQTLSQEIIFPPGAGELPTLKIGAVYKAQIPDGGNSGHYVLIYRDRNFAGRAGWKEIVAMAEPSVELLTGSVPQIDRSSQLNNYPADLLNSPPQDLAARISFTLPARSAPMANTESPANRTSAEAAASNRRLPAHEQFVGDGRDRPSPPPAVNGTASSAAPDSPNSVARMPGQLQAARPSTPRDSFTELIAAPQSGWGIVLMALAVAIGLGAFHALEPGHGKTLVAAYLVGSKGTTKQALLLGLIVTTAHTAGVYLLGGVTLYASHYIVPERLYPWLALFSGVGITVLGVVLVVQRYRSKAMGHSHHHHDHGSHTHDHVHGHEQDHHHHHSHEHAHATASLRELLTLGISGGIVPCPAALVVLLSAVSMNRVGFGLLLIVAFSAGLAAVLIGIGLLMVYGSRFMSRFQNEGTWVTRWLPITSSAFIVVLGVGLTRQAWLSAGFPLLAG